MITRPALRYHGGKWRLADWIISHLPQHHCYVEPFGGPMSVLLRKPASAIEVYNDLDSHVVGFFRVLQNPMLAEQLRRSLENTPYSRAEFVLAWRDCADPVEAARRMVIRTANRSAPRRGWPATAGVPAPPTTPRRPCGAGGHSTFRRMSIDCGMCSSMPSRPQT